MTTIANPGRRPGDLPEALAADSGGAPLAHVPVTTLLRRAKRCRERAAVAKPDHALQWLFAALVLEFLADDAVTPADDPRRKEWGTTAGWIRSRKSG